MDTAMAKTKPNNADIKDMSFERALKELETIVNRLERGDVELEELIALVDRDGLFKLDVAPLQTPDDRPQLLDGALEAHVLDVGVPRSSGHGELCLPPGDLPNSLRRRPPSAS